MTYKTYSEMIAWAAKRNVDHIESSEVAKCDTRRRKERR